MEQQNKELAEDKVLILYLLNKIFDGIKNDNLYKIVSSSKDINYFYFQELLTDLIDTNLVGSFTKEEDVYKRSLQAAKKGRILTFQWRGGYLTREVLEKLLDLLRKAGEEKQKAARISLNWSQAVIRVSYVEDRGLACVDMEEANEGEKE